MRLFCLVLLIISATHVFSQTDDKSMQRLFDSLNTIHLTDNLYNQISYLKQKDSSNAHDIYQQSKIIEYYVRQNVYRDLFDKIESGQMPQEDSLTAYYHTLFYDSLFRISDLNSGYPIIIFLSSDTVKIPYGEEGWIPAYGGDFAQRMAEMDASLAKIYPRVFEMLLNGSIQFQYSGYFNPVGSEVPKFNFPTFYLKDNTLIAKKALANDLLEFIYDAENILRRFSDSYGFDGNLVPEYLKLEQKKFSKATIDAKIEFRRKFIEYLKQQYGNYP